MLFLSIKPKYVDKILSGEKRVELRRRKPRSLPGDWVAIYETSPTKALVAIAQVIEVRVMSPHCLWRSVNSIAGVNKREFDDYFMGANQAVGIVIQTPLKLSKPIQLDDLRKTWDRFNPPQGYLYLTQSQSQHVIDRVAAAKRLNAAA